MRVAKNDNVVGSLGSVVVQRFHSLGNERKESGYQTVLILRLT